MKGTSCNRPYSHWMRGLCFKSYYWLTGRRSPVRSADRLEQLHRAPRLVIDAAVRRSLCHLLDYAARNVPYYRDLIGSTDISEATVGSVLETMPILTKDIVRKETSRLTSEESGIESRWNTSGGSTGEPIRLLQDRHMSRQRLAGKLLFRQWAGYRIGEPYVMVWAVPKKTFGQRTSLHQRVYNFMHNQVFLNCYGIDDDMLRDWVYRINAIHPVFIEAYADAIYAVSQLIIAEKLTIESPRAIITSAGVLDEHMREVIVEAFGCPVLNRYGSREVSDMACSCGMNNELHVNEFSHYLEVVDDEGRPCAEGTEGNILVTLLNNHSMPLIRYQIEDRGVWASGPCVCGRNSRRIARVCGRQNDYLLASDGTRISGIAVTTVLYPVVGVKRYQYRQISSDRVILTVVPLQGTNVEELKVALAKVMEKLRQLLKGNSVELAIVDDITPSKSGKFRYILNELSGV